MGWISVCGTGATIHDVRFERERALFTTWLSLFWVPLIPVRSWSAIWLCHRPADGLRQGSEVFIDLRRTPHEPLRLLKTFGAGLLGACVALGPMAFMIARVTDRAATTGEVVVVLATAAWPMVVLTWVERMRRSRLERSRPAAPPAAAGTPRSDEARQPAPAAPRAPNEMSPRIVGVLCLAGGAVFAWLGWIEPLRAAARHETSVGTYMQAALLAPALLFVGVTFTLLGDAVPEGLRSRWARSPLGRWVYGALLLAGVASYAWVKSRLRATGYG